MANQAIDNNADAVLADYMRRTDAGETVDRDAFIAAHPQVAEELREYFDSVDEVERMAGPPLASTVKNGVKAVETHVSSVGDSVSEKPARQTQSANKSNADSLPETFGRYRIEKQLGRGAMGAVCLAHDTQLDRQVALKMPTFDVAADDEMVERFYREARAAANLRHAGICPIFDVGKIDGTHYISMAYIEGKPMSALVDVDKPLPIRSVVSLVRKIALALDHAHNQGVIHRDLKPANIMIDKQKQPLIMDFGLARRVDQHEQTRLTQDGMILGTPAYMSPEQVQGDLDSGKQSDVYSLGVILYELLTGDLPFQGTVAAVIGQIVTQDAPPPSGERPEVDAVLDAICQKMMARKLEDRYASTKEAADALTDFLKGMASGRRKPADTNAKEIAPGPQATVTADEGLAEFLEAPSKEEFPAVKTRRDGTLTQLVAPWKKLPPRTKVIATSILAGLLLLLGVIIMVRTPEGTVRVEVLSDEDVEVLIDGNSIQLIDAKWQDKRKASEHRLGLKVGGVTIPFSAASQHFVCDGGHFTVMVGEVELKSERFDVVSNGTTVLKIRYKQDDKAPQPLSPKNDYDEIATGKWVTIPPEDAVSSATDGTKLRGNAIEMRSWLMLPDTAGRNMLLRCRIKSIEQPRVSALFLRVDSPDTEQFDTCVSFWITNKQLAGIDSVYDGEKKHLVERRYSNNEDGGVELTFAVLDDELIGFVDGKRVCSARNTHPSVNGIGRIQVHRGVVEITNIEYMPLRQLAPSQGTGEKGKVGLVKPRIAGPAQPYLIAQFDHKAHRTKESYIAVLSPDAARVAYRMERDDPLQMFETVSQQQIELPQELQNASTMDYNADGTRFATGHPDGTVRIWNSQTLEQLGQPLVANADSWVSWVSLSDDGSRVLARTIEQPPKFYVWDVESRKPFTDPFALNDVEKAKGVHVASSADNRLLAIAYYEKEEGSKHFVQLWDVKTGQPRDTQFVPNEGSLKTIYDIDLSPRGDRLAVACKRGECFVFDTATGKQTLSTSHGGWRVLSARFSPDGRQLATCGGPPDSEDMHLWDLETGEELVRWSLPKDAESFKTDKFGALTSHLVYSRNGSRLLTAGVNTPVCVWKLKSTSQAPQDPIAPPTPTVAGTSWTDLFNGKDLTGWQQMRTTGRQDDVHRPTTGDWVVQNEQIICNSSNSGWLKSVRQFDNFELELEFKLSQLGNSGVYIRSSGSGRLSRSGVEVQVIDDTAAKFKLTSKNRSGAIHNVVGPSKSALRSIGEWNTMSIRCEGDLIQVTLNGVVTAKRNMADDSALRGRPRSGFLGFSNWHGEGKGTAFRNIRVRELEKTADASSPGSQEPQPQIRKQLKKLEEVIFPWLVWVHAENDQRTPLAVATTSGLCCVYPGSFSEVEISSLDLKQKTNGAVGSRKPSPFCWIDPATPRTGGIRLGRGGTHRIAQPAVIVMQQDGKPQVQVGQVNTNGTFTPEIPYNPPTRGVTAPGPIFNASGECLGYGVRPQRGQPIKIYPLRRQ